MREKLKDYVNSLFQGAPDTEHIRELREEIMQNTLDRYDDLVAQGCSEDSAFGQAVASIGDVRQLWTQAPTPVRAKKSRTGWIIGGCVAVAAVAALIAGAFAQRSRPSPAHYEQNKKTSLDLDDGVEEIVDWAMDLGEDIVEDVMKNTGNFGTINLKYDHPEQYTAGPAELAVGEVQEIELNWLSGSVTVEAYDGSVISISETEQSDEAMQLHWRQNGKKLEIQPFSHGKHTNVPSKDLLVRIPASLAENLQSLEIDTTSADAFVSGLTLGTLQFESTSGSLDAQADCRKLEADTTSGEINFTGTASSVEANTTSGGMRFTGTASEVEIDTVSGGFVLNLTETPDKLSFDSTSGSISLTLPADRGFRAEMDTVSGGWNCAYETQQPRKHTWTYAGTGSGREAELEFETVSGSVEILKAE